MPKILFSGDIHLGRRPSRIPDNVEEYGLSISDLTPAAAWRNLVRYAISNEVSAVVLAGDVVDQENDTFEAFGHLLKGTQDLAEANIPLYAIGGNHDMEALPRLADLIPQFHLIGRGGRWEQETLHIEGQPVAQFVGWSYPQKQVTQNPFEISPFDIDVDDNVPTFGLLHGDMNASGTPYAPFSKVHAERTGIINWFLGHTHVPSNLDPENTIGYLGSLTGLDPGETGARGAWLVNLSGREIAEVKHLHLAPLRWERREINLDELESPEDIQSLLVSEIESLHGEISNNLGELKSVGCRIYFVGRTLIHRKVRMALPRLRIEDHRQPLDGVFYFVEKVVNRSLPAIDLEEIAQDKGPQAILAQRILSLQKKDKDSLDHISNASRELEKVSANPAWSHLTPTDLTEEQVADLLIEVGTVALEELVAQKGMKEGDQPE